MNDLRFVPMGRNPGESDLPVFLCLIERFQNRLKCDRFFPGYPMLIEDIHVVNAQTLQAEIQLLEKFLGRCSFYVEACRSILGEIHFSANVKGIPGSPLDD